MMRRHELAYDLGTRTVVTAAFLVLAVLALVVLTRLL